MLEVTVKGPCMSHWLTSSDDKTKGPALALQKSIIGYDPGPVQHTYHPYTLFSYDLF
jgi:hypothetical protein